MKQRITPCAKISSQGVVSDKLFFAYISNFRAKKVVAKSFKSINK